MLQDDTCLTRAGVASRARPTVNGVKRRQVPLHGAPVGVAASHAGDAVACGTRMARVARDRALPHLAAPAVVRMRCYLVHGRVLRQWIGCHVLPWVSARACTGMRAATSSAADGQTHLTVRRGKCWRAGHAPHILPCPRRFVRRRACMRAMGTSRCCAACPEFYQNLGWHLSPHFGGTSAPRLALASAQVLWYTRAVRAGRAHEVMVYHRAPSGSTWGYDSAERWEGRPQCSEKCPATDEAEQIVEGMRFMASRCDMCGRHPQYGHRVSHSNRKTHRQFRVNLQRHRLQIGGVMRSMHVCTRCLRTLVRVPKK